MNAKSIQNKSSISFSLGKLSKVPTKKCWSEKHESVIIHFHATVNFVYSKMNNLLDSILKFSSLIYSLHWRIVRLLKLLKKKIETPHFSLFRSRGDLFSENLHKWWTKCTLLLKQSKNFFLPFFDEYLNFFFLSRSKKSSDFELIEWLFF